MSLDVVYFNNIPMGALKRPPVVRGGLVRLTVTPFREWVAPWAMATMNVRGAVPCVVRGERMVAHGDGLFVEVTETFRQRVRVVTRDSSSVRERKPAGERIEWLGEMQEEPLYGPWPKGDDE